MEKEVVQMWVENVVTRIVAWGYWNHVQFVEGY